MSGDYPKHGEKWACGCWAEPIDEYACHQHVCQAHTQTRYTSYASVEDLRVRLAAESEAAFAAGVTQFRKDRDELRDMLGAVAERLSRRIANAKHGPDCSNCQADKELVTLAAGLIARVKAGKR